MEIYTNTNGSIFGIQMYNFNDDGISNVFFEQTYEEVMSCVQLREMYYLYSLLANKNKILFNIYTESSSTVSDRIMVWQPFPLDTFLEIFGKCVKV